MLFPALMRLFRPKLFFKRFADSSTSSHLLYFVPFRSSDRCTLGNTIRFRVLFQVWRNKKYWVQKMKCNWRDHEVGKLNPTWGSFQLHATWKWLQHQVVGDIAKNLSFEKQISTLKILCIGIANIMKHVLRYLTSSPLKIQNIIKFI